MYHVKQTPRRGRCAKPRELKLKIFVVVLFALIIVGLVLTFHFYNRQQHILEVGKAISFDEETRLLTVGNAAQDTVLVGQLGLGLNTHELPFKCTEDASHSSEMCLYWKDRANLTIHYYEEDQTNCYQIRWNSTSEHAMPWDCYDFGNAHWYGGGLFQGSNWPLQNASFQKTPYVLGSTLRSHPYGPVIEPYWLTSKGVAIFVDDGSPLHVSFNATPIGSDDRDGRICFYADYTDLLYYNKRNELPVMNYTICVDKDIKQVHQAAIRKIAKPPSQFPNDNLFKSPLWSTWGCFKDNITQRDLVEYTEAISQRQYGHSVLVIDDNWQSAIGDLTFNKERFPDVSDFITKTKKLGFNISVSISPFVAANSDAFQDAVFNDYAVLDHGGAAPGTVWWWHGMKQRMKTLVAVLDMHGQSQSWFGRKLLKFLQEHNIDSLQAGGGDNSWLPYGARFHDNSTTPNQFAHQYASLISKTGSCPLIETAYKCQHLAALPRLYDAHSRWDSPLGLSDVIPRYLTLGLLGYTYPVPDPAGGTGYSGAPSKALFLRWLGMQTFFPIMHLSTPPHSSHFDAETEQLAAHFITKHDTELLGTILDLARESLETRIPVVRPLWWIAPTDTAALTDDTEFMLGDRILVAPILKEGNQRDIYLPQGKWRDQLEDGPDIEGPITIAYTASLGQVPHFELQYEQKSV